ncbi:MAG: hypothetical protein WB041_14730, partial [Pseudolabrys sp.]
AWECPLWVKSRHLQWNSACPLYPRKRSALGDCLIFLDAFVIGDQPEGKAKDHSDVVYNQNDNPAVRGQSSPDG